MPVSRQTMRRPVRLGEINELEGKVAVVTGGSRGLGAAVALRLGEASLSTADGSLKEIPSVLPSCDVFNNNEI